MAGQFCDRMHRKRKLKQAEIHYNNSAAQCYSSSSRLISSAGLNQIPKHKNRNKLVEAIASLVDSGLSGRSSLLLLLLRRLLRRRLVRIDKPGLDLKIFENSLQLGEIVLAPDLEPAVPVLIDERMKETVERQRGLEPNQVVPVVGAGGDILPDTIQVNSILEHKGHLGSEGLVQLTRIRVLAGGKQLVGEVATNQRAVGESRDNPGRAQRAMKPSSGGQEVRGGSEAITGLPANGDGNRRILAGIRRLNARLATVHVGVGEKLGVAKRNNPIDKGGRPKVTDGAATPPLVVLDQAGRSAHSGLLRGIQPAPEVLGSIEAGTKKSKRPIVQNRPLDLPTAAPRARLRPMRSFAGPAPLRGRRRRAAAGRHEDPKSTDKRENHGRNQSRAAKKNRRRIKQQRRHRRLCSNERDEKTRQTATAKRQNVAENTERLGNSDKIS